MFIVEDHVCHPMGYLVCSMWVPAVREGPGSRLRVTSGSYDLDQSYAKVFNSVPHEVFPIIC